MASLNKRYTLGYILDAEGTRMETRVDDINHLVQYLLQTNFIMNVDIVYVSINFSTETNEQINSKLSVGNVYVWVTAVEDSKVLRLWESFFKYVLLPTDPSSTMYYPQNSDKFLISVVDELQVLKDYFNILHVNNIRDIIANQYANIIWNKISTFADQSYTTVYVFYDNEHAAQKDLFLSLITTLDVNNYKTFIPCNVDNYIEFSQIITKIQNDTTAQLLTSNNTMFVYFMNSLDVYFQVYAIVEDPILIADIYVSSNVRHYPYYQSYTLTNFIKIDQLMKQYLVPKFIDDPTPTNISQFFQNNLRCFLIGPALTKYQGNKFNYLNYTYYVKAPINAQFLGNHRITIYSVMVEKALKLAANILYRNITNLDLLYSGSFYFDGKTFGTINLEITNNNLDYSYFNRLIYITYNLKDIYYISDINLRKLRNDPNDPIKTAITPFYPKLLLTDTASTEKNLLKSLTNLITNINNPTLEPPVNYNVLTNSTLTSVGFDMDCSTINKFKTNQSYKTDFIYSIFNIQTI